MANQNGRCDLTTELTKARLKELLHYDAESGHFRWRISPRSDIPAGTRAGHRKYSKGKSYRFIKIDGKSYPEHRLAVLYITGSWPKGIVDHDNGDGVDNRWDNIYDRTQSQNQLNRQGPNKNNATGLRGVRELSSGRWQARINGQSLGTFDTLEAAQGRLERAYKEAGI